MNYENFDLKFSQSELQFSSTSQMTKETNSATSKTYSEYSDEICKLHNEKFWNEHNFVNTWFWRDGATEWETFLILGKYECKEIIPRVLTPFSLAEADGN